MFKKERKRKRADGLAAVIYLRRLSVFWMRVHAMAKRHAEFVHEPRQCVADLSCLQGMLVISATVLSCYAMFYSFLFVLFPFFVFCSACDLVMGTIVSNSDFVLHLWDFGF